MGRKIVDLSGRTVGKLQVISLGRKEGKRYYWKCHCACGTEKEILGSNLVGESPTVSCGCIRQEVTRKRKHGMAGTRIYKCWHSMLERCRNPNDSRYENYGARGIKVCEKWHEFSNFYADMGGIPEGRSLDRIDNDGDYSPENCRWATPQEQTSNTRRNIFVTVEGTTQTLTAWARDLGVSFGTLRYRYKVGNWPSV